MKNVAVLALLSVGTVQAVTDAQLASAITAIESLVPEDNSGLRDFAGGIIRLAAHDGMGIGGMDGCVDLQNVHNGGLASIIDLLQPAYSAAGGAEVLSRADFWTLAATVAVRATGGPLLDFNWGRLDCADPSNPGSSVGLIPESDPVGSTFGHITSTFDRLGFTAREVAALFGAHTLGRAEAENSGFSGSWVNDPAEFDNEYYRDLLNRPWNRRQQNGKQVWLNGDRLMLDTDIALLVDPDTCNRVGGGRGDNPDNCVENDATLSAVRDFAGSNAMWFSEFGDAFTKLMSVGSNSLERAGELDIEGPPENNNNNQGGRGKGGGGRGPPRDGNGDGGRGRGDGGGGRGDGGGGRGPPPQDGDGVNGDGGDGGDGGRGPPPPRGGGGGGGGGGPQRRGGGGGGRNGGRRGI